MVEELVNGRAAADIWLSEILAGRASPPAEEVRVELTETRRREDVLERLLRLVEAAERMGS